MNKIVTVLGAIIFASISLISCGDSGIEQDAKNYAEAMCRANRIASEASVRAASGDMSAISESTRLAAEAATIAKEMKNKYNDASDSKKFYDAYLNAMRGCN